MKFSVIIPTYNREQELSKCIESVLNQTYKNFELIVVDNGSTDNTKEVVQKYVDNDNRVKYFWQENSGSPAGSRNTGIKHSSNEWISFLDSDDYWYSNKIEELTRTIKSNSNVIAVSHFEDKEVDGIKVAALEHGHNLFEVDDIYSTLLFRGNSLSTSAMTVKREKLVEVGLFDERKDYFAVEDYDMWMKLSLKGKFAYIKEPLGVFSISGSNMSGNVELINTNLKTLIFNHIDLLKDNKDKERLKRIHGSRVEYYRGRTYQMNGNFKKAIPILINTIKEYPFCVKKYISLLFAFFGITK